MSPSPVMDYLQPASAGNPYHVRPDSRFWAEASFNREYSTFPLTVEGWVRLNSSDQINVILANGYKTAIGYIIIANHWSIYTQKSTGHLGVHLQNMEPSDVIIKRSVVDGEWHFLAMVYEINRVQVFIDGEKVLEQVLTPRLNTHPLGEWSNEGPLFFGCYPPDGSGCDGEIKEVRISHRVREIDRVPHSTLSADHGTVGLWLFDCGEGTTFVQDLSQTGNPVRIQEYLPSLDENDRRAFGVWSSPFSHRTMLPVHFSNRQMKDKPVSGKFGIEDLLLNGNWDCQPADPHGTSEMYMLWEESAWDNSFSAPVPCSIQTALLENGLIEDPMIQMNNLNISWVADREWWLRKKFTLPAEWQNKRVELRFDGVDYRATFWLNGCRLGQHEGMFGGPDYDVTNLLYTGDRENILVVCLDPAPLNYEDTMKNNVAYGWHYVKLITLGIWRPVHLIQRSESALIHPFLTTTYLEGSTAHVELALDCWHWGKEPDQLDLEINLIPKNFSGDGYAFKQSILITPGSNQIGFSGELENVHLWWPVDMGGKPDLYWFECILKKHDQVIDHYRAHWGARTVVSRPAADGPNPHGYNFQLIINSQPVWIKGANWCYVEALLRLDRKRSARFIELARNSHIQLLRVWGGGPVENDEFYDLCDEMGMMVQQEFSMLGFHRLQNVPSIHATDITHYMVPRLRNRPSLVIWSAANEISGVGRIVEVLGRRCLELDGTRPFRRSCPYGGDVHWYGVYWGGQPLLDYRKVADGRIQAWSPELGSQQTNGPVAFTEFGLSSPPNLESWQRIIPESELEQWPPDPNSVFIHHTPTWEYVHVKLMSQYASEFLDPTSFPKLIKGMQLSQGLGLKILIESMRVRKPFTTATYFYKLTENYPACSWATIDYYGVPKRSHYDIQEAYQPVHVMALYDDWNIKDGKLSLSIHALNDSSTPLIGGLGMKLFDGSLSVIHENSVELVIPTDRSVLAGKYEYSIPAGSSQPLFLCLELVNDGILIDRNWYYFNFVQDQGCLFTRPKTHLLADLHQDDGNYFMLVKNLGQVPALSVELDFGLASNTYYADRNGFWLYPGETEKISVIKTIAVDGETRPLNQLILSAWNADPQQFDLKK